MPLFRFLVNSLFRNNEITKERVNEHMKLIVGLGNPGRVYIDSRHNIGFLVIRALSQIYTPRPINLCPLVRINCGTSSIPPIGTPEAYSPGGLHKIPLKKDDNTLSLTTKGKIKNQNIILAMPLTFMNLSGLAISALVKKYKIDLENLLVICDDLDLELGRLKIMASGSSGGHRGLKSIIDSLMSQKFSRLRIGIGRPKPNMDAAEYVLSPFTKKEKEQIKDSIQKAVECCWVWVLEGITKSMSIFNRRSK